MALLSEAEVDAFLDAHKEWHRDDDQITRVFTFADFAGSIAFVNVVAELADRADHHPDIDIRWNKVTLTLSTHSEGGLTARDLELAAQIDALPG